MLNLNDLRVFEKVAALKSFSAAARALELPKSSISRAVTRLEKELGARLFQRTTREVTLTDTGTALQERCIDILYRVGETLDYVGGLRATPRGRLNVTAGIGFGVNVLSELLPRFIERYPEDNVCVDLTSQAVDLVTEGVDLAIRMGPMPSSQAVAKRLAASGATYAQRRVIWENTAHLGRLRIWVSMTGDAGDQRPPADLDVFEFKTSDCKDRATAAHHRQLPVDDRPASCQWRRDRLCVGLSVYAGLQNGPLDPSLVRVDVAVRQGQRGVSQSPRISPGGQGIRGLYPKRLAARCVVARRGLTFTTPTYDAH